MSNQLIPKVSKVCVFPVKVQLLIPDMGQCSKVSRRPSCFYLIALLHVDFIPNFPHSPKWLLQLHPSDHHSNQPERKRSRRQACPYHVMILLLNGNIDFICISVARTLPYSSPLEGKYHFSGRPGDQLQGQVLLQRKREGQKGERWAGA